MTEAQPTDFAETLDALKRRVHEARYTLQRRANAELVALYWYIGHTILDKQKTSAWGSGVVTRLATELQTEFPTMRGFSRSNLFSMRAFAAAWPERNGIVRQPVGQLPWTHIVQLLEKLDDQALREWYAGKDVQQSWSRAELINQITTRLHERDGAAPSNFAAALARPDSDLAQQLMKDPDTMGFLGVGADLSAGPACPPAPLVDGGRRHGEAARASRHAHARVRSSPRSRRTSAARRTRPR